MTTYFARSLSNDQIYELEVFAREDGTTRLWDKTCDPQHHGDDDLLVDDSARSVADVLTEEFELVNAYNYVHDGGSGVIYAADFVEACEKFDAMLTPAVIADGGNGWIADVDGYRREIGNEASNA